MSQSELLTQLQTAFAPYIKSSEDLHDVRLNIAKHIASLRPQEQGESVDSRTFSIPPHVTGIRRQYLQALQENIQAKQEYTSLQDQIRSQAPRPTDVESVELSPVKATQTHLVLLHLRRQHQKYQILADYLTQAESLASQSQNFDTQPPILEPPFYKSDVPHSSQEQDDLQARINDLNRALKLAVLRGHHQLNRSRQSLDALKASRDPAETPSSEAKLRALAATNRELTRWIEESLAKCDSASHDEDTIDQGGSLSQGAEPADRNASIDDMYEKYIAARKQLLDAAIALTSPLPIPTTVSDSTDTGAHDTDPKNQSLERASSTTTSINTYKPTTSLLPHLTNIHLPALSHQKSISQAETHLSTLLSTHETSLLDQLLRLSEESHLLPSYPILAKQNSKSRRADGETEPNQTESLLGAWRFAMGAAGTATGATVEKQIKIGNEAVDEVNLVLDGVQEQEGLWEKLEGMRR